MLKASMAIKKMLTMQSSRMYRRKDRTEVIKYLIGHETTFYQILCKINTT